MYKAKFMSGLLGLFALVFITHSQAAFVNYQSTVVVSPVGPTETDNGLELINQLSTITTGVPAPSATNRYLLKVEPGVYDVGNTTLLLPAYVDLEGSGENLTLIRGTAVDALPAGQGVVSVGANAELRLISVENNAAGFAIDSAAVLLLGGSSIDRVTALSTGDSPSSRAVMVGLSDLPRPRASNVTAQASTRALQVFYPGLDGENIVTLGAEGLFVSSGDVLIRNSVLNGTLSSLFVTNLSTTHVATTQLKGDIICPKKHCRCFASYDEDLKPIKPKCKKK